MEIVPVIDLKGGKVVRAFKGERASYQPIVSPLAASSDPCDVVAGFLRLYPFPAIYVADLDAIERCGDNREIVLALARAFPNIRFWVDDGACEARALRDWLGIENADPVLGAEKLASVEAARGLADDARVLLSLDFGAERFLGPKELLERPALWPRRVIVMTLARVGAFEGPDVSALETVERFAGSRRLYAAGGVRDMKDVEILARAGAAGALVASALHDGRLTNADLSNGAIMK